MLALKFDIVIDCAVGAPGHGKDVVDGLNAVDKRFLRTAMMRILNPEEEFDSKCMLSHTANQSTFYSFAKVCRKLLQEHADGVAAMTTEKSGKREKARKYASKKYFVQKKEDVPFHNLKMTWTQSCFKSIKVADGRSKVCGCETVISHYHYRVDPKLGEGKCLMRRIPCLCQACNSQLKRKWLPGVEPSNQPRYQNVTNCKYSNVLGDYNQWIIMPFQFRKDTNEDDLEQMHHTILTSIASNIAATIAESSYGAVNTEDPQTDGYYIVKFISSPYTLQNDVVVNGDRISSGMLVCDAEYLSPAFKGSNWYVTPIGGTISVIIQMSKVLISNIDVKVVTERSQLDRDMKKLSNADILSKKPFRLSDNDRKTIIDEIKRRDAMEYVVGDCDINETEAI